MQVTFSRYISFLKQNLCFAFSGQDAPLWSGQDAPFIFCYFSLRNDPELRTKARQAVTNTRKHFHKRKTSEKLINLIKFYCWGCVLPLCWGCVLPRLLGVHFTPWGVRLAPYQSSLPYLELVSNISFLKVMNMNFTVIINIIEAQRFNLLHRRFTLILLSIYMSNFNDFP